MTTHEGVKKNVFEIVRKIVKPGTPVTKTVWRAAYNIARIEAIKDTVAWKMKYITIE